MNPLLVNFSSRIRYSLIGIWKADLRACANEIKKHAWAKIIQWKPREGGGYLPSGEEGCCDEGRCDWGSSSKLQTMKGVSTIK